MNSEFIKEKYETFLEKQIAIFSRNAWPKFPGISAMNLQWNISDRKLLPKLYIAG